MKWDDLHVKAVFSAADDGEDLENSALPSGFHFSAGTEYVRLKWVTAGITKHSQRAEHYRTASNALKIQLSQTTETKSSYAHMIFPLLKVTVRGHALRKGLNTNFCRSTVNETQWQQRLMLQSHNSRNRNNINKCKITNS